MNKTYKKVIGAVVGLAMLSAVGFAGATGYGSPFDALAHLRLMRQTVKDFPGNSPAERNLVKRINNMIELYKEGKVAKSELKMERVVSDMEKRLAKPKHKDFKKLTTEQAQAVLDLANQYVQGV